MRIFALVAFLSVLSSCAGSATPSTNPNPPEGASSAVRRAGLGGTFTASYSGTWTGACHVHEFLTTCKYKLTGTGSGSYIGTSTITADAKCYVTNGFPTGWGTSAVLRSEKRSKNNITIIVKSFLAGECGYSADYKVRGGHGRFKGATGGGSVSISGLSASGSGDFSSSLQGTLTF